MQVNIEKQNLQYAVEMEGITKVFLDTIIANNNISIKIKKGEIHALVGENGAGKSTLMSILFGLYQPTKGIIKINGKEVVISGPIRAGELGIGMVHQHFKLVDNFTILQNIILGSEPVHKWQWINYKKAKSKILEISKKYKLDIKLNLKIENASVGMQQRVEILKVLYRGASIIVLDEPTAVLTPQEITSLLTIIEELRRDGKTIIFISHKLEEVKQVADNVTVIRLGKVIETFESKSKTKEEIATLMVGRDLVDIRNQGNVVLGPVLLKIDNLFVHKIGNRKSIMGLSDFSLEVKSREIVAIAGIEGNGQTELISAITGLIKPEKGDIFFGNKNMKHSSIRSLYKSGLSHIPEDRHKYGLVLDYNVIDNMVLQNISEYPFSKHGLIRSKAIQSYAQNIINNYDVRGSKSGFALVRGLSGGNQQKAVVGRELTRKHKILVVAQPTRGLDIGAIEYIHSRILDEKNEGNAVLLISYELSEVMSLADRIVVLHAGKITGNVSAKNVTREQLGLMMAGQKMLMEGNEDNV
ncbi:MULTISPECIES: ABC transporter ATP-binding protein [unclassified Spiroplasma]|uniref:ABC transporter ATP-binding protein n=1 Tax=unclassified Spiroplasma TaxID=2637901 RepID=UPI0020799CF9|nr:ATP-binding cassette domain-containing protein [Spiroplasma endosymbiont of Lariophagus distinguendus]